MRCSHCNEAAQFKCGCPLPYMCSSHFSEHFSIAGNHPFETLSFTIENPRLSNLKSLAVERLKSIKNAKLELTIKTSSLMKAIKAFHDQAIENLDTLSDIYFDFLPRTTFFESELESIAKLEFMKISSIKVETTNILSELEKIYSKEFVNFVQNNQLRENLEESKTSIIGSANEISVRDSKWIDNAKDERLSINNQKNLSTVISPEKSKSLFSKN